MEWLHPEHLIQTFGTIGVLTVVFVESGLLIGFFLPGDSLLFTAGLLAAADYGGLNVTVLAVGSALAAIAGDQVGYTIGRRSGPRLLEHERWFTRPRHVERARHFFATKGGRAVLLARFIPIVRTFVPVVAGVVEMPYRTFVAWNIGGGILWGAGVTVAGYLLGEAIPDIDRFLLPIIAVIIFLSVLPAFLHLRRSSDDRGTVEASSGPGGPGKEVVEQ